MPKAKRKKYGQFFTSKETAVFMAGLFSIPEDKPCLEILDPGAGSGVLSVALIERLQTRSSIQHIDLTCYETDTNIIPLLKTNLDWVCQNALVHVTYQIISDNYILSQMAEYNGMIGANPQPRKYDLVIGNPPYMKVSKDAPEAKAMPDVCYGAPNLYFLFASMSLFNLIADGELVYIIPRSWTSGAYFKRRLSLKSVKQQCLCKLSQSQRHTAIRIFLKSHVLRHRITQLLPARIHMYTW